MTKFDSLKDEVVYRASLDGTCETVGSVQELGFWAFVTDFYGSDYIVREDGQGFVEVDRYARTGVMPSYNFSDACAAIRGEQMDYEIDSYEQDAWEARNEY